MLNIRECDLPNINKTGIYCITNLVNDKKYIGQAIRKYGFINRWKTKYNQHLTRAFEKYGKDNFEYSVIEVIEQGDTELETYKNIISFWETYWILYYNTLNREKGYNECRYSHSTKGSKFYQTKEHKEKIKQAQLKWWKEHPEAKKESSNKAKQRYKEHPELKKFGKDNSSTLLEVKEKISFSQIEYYKKHPEKKKILSDKAKQRYKEHPELKKFGKDNVMYNKEPWNKGKTNIFSKETLEKMRGPRKSIIGDKNPSKRLDVREKISKALKGKRNGGNNPSAKEILIIDKNTYKILYTLSYCGDINNVKDKHDLKDYKLTYSSIKHACSKNKKIKNIKEAYICRNKFIIIHKSIYDIIDAEFVA